MKFRRRWTDQDFPQMSWHDNHIHGFYLAGGDRGTGSLILDIDYILDWVKVETGKFRFNVAPAVLAFHYVANLRLGIDFAEVTAAVGPVSIGAIERTSQADCHQLWRIGINWPTGFISFQARGFVQELRGDPVLWDTQRLNRNELEWRFIKQQN